MKSLFKKIVNTFLTPKYLFKYVIRKKHLESFLIEENKNNLLHKIIFFWPRISNAYSWKEGKKGAYRDPQNFIEMREGIDNLLLNKIIDLNKNKKKSILDLGCNSGRHLNFLYQNGFTNLHGVDIMKSALENFYLNFPDCYNITKKHHDLFQKFLKDSNNREYDTVYTVGATIELIHPSFDIIGEMCRVANEYIILLVQESSQEYPRFYVYEFNRHNFKLIESKRPIDGSNISFLCFKKFVK